MRREDEEIAQGHGPSSVALSGGGYRASLYGLGSLLYLVDAGANRSVYTISSVSGGSIVSAYVAQECDFNSVEPEEFREVAGRFARTIVERGLLETPVVRAYVIGLTTSAVVLGSCLLWKWPFSMPWWASMLSLLAVTLAVLARGIVVEKVLGDRFYSPGGRATKLGDLTRECKHVFCTTDLTEGCPLYFVAGMGGHICDPLQVDRFTPWSRSPGWAEAREVELRSAVRASAAYPGAIPPRRLSFLDKSSERRTVYLADGGVWNNLATQWWEVILPGAPPDLGEEQWRRACWKLQIHTRLFVANASAPTEAVSRRHFRFPVLSLLRSTTRSIALLNANTVQPRVQGLRERAERYYRDLGHVDPRAYRENPSVASIDEQPGRFASHVRGYLERLAEPTWRVGDLSAENPEFQELSRPQEAMLDRAKTWEHRGLLARYWVEDCARLPTGLQKIELESAARLIILGFVHAMEAMHVAYGTPLLDEPSEEDVLAMISR